MGKALTNKDFIEKCSKIHNNKYDYSHVKYKNTRTKIHIICPIHGDFYQKADTHLHGHGCPKCGHETTLSFRKSNTIDFIQKAKKIHGDKYDYSKVKYINSKTKVCITCPIHGDFFMKPNDHLSRKYGCHKCGWIQEGMDSRKTTEEFIKAAKEKYGDKAAHGVVIITLKKPQELDEIVVVRYGEQSDEPELLPFYLLEPDTMPTFQGGDRNECARWLNKRIYVPEGCNHGGKMKGGFVVDENGEVKDVKILESVCPELDASMLFLVSLSPKWEPATASGHAVAQFLTIPIEFQLR